MFKIDSLKFLLKNNVAVTTAVVIGFAAAVLFVNTQIVALKDEISTVEISLNNRIDAVEDRIDEVEISLNNRIDEVEERMIRGFEDMQELLVNIVQRLPQQPVQHSALTLN